MLTETQIDELLADEEFKNSILILGNEAHIREMLKKHPLNKAQLELVFGGYSPIVSAIDELEEMLGKEKAALVLTLAVDRDLNDEQFKKLIQPLSESCTKAVENIRQIALNKDTIVEKDWQVGTHAIREQVPVNAVDNLLGKQAEGGKLSETGKEAAADLVRNFVTEKAKKLDSSVEVKAKDEMSKIKTLAPITTASASANNTTINRPNFGRNYHQGNDLAMSSPTTRSARSGSSARPSSENVVSDLSMLVFMIKYLEQIAQLAQFMLVLSLLSNVSRHPMLQKSVLDTLSDHNNNASVISLSFRR